MSELHTLHQQLEVLGAGIAWVLTISLILGMYYIFYRILIRIVRKGVKAALAESCVCKKKND